MSVYRLRLLIGALAALSFDSGSVFDYTQQLSAQIQEALRRHQELQTGVYGIRHSTKAQETE